MHLMTFFGKSLNNILKKNLVRHDFSESVKNLPKWTKQMVKRPLLLKKFCRGLRRGISEKLVIKIDIYTIKASWIFFS